MAAVTIPYVETKRVKRRTYYYFRYDADGHGRNAKRIRIRGVPGTREFTEHYEELVATKTPQATGAVRLSNGERHGTLGWVITQFKNPEKSPAWKKAGASTREVYVRHLDWLHENDGSSMLASFDKQVVRGIRNKFLDRPTVGNAVLKRLSQLWIFAEEYCGLILPANPVREVVKLDVDGEAAWVWTPELFTAYESNASETDLTFYMLARYTGQRKGDCCDMGWTDIDLKGNRIHVVQEKTGVKIWVPLHKRLRKYLTTLPRRGTHILTSPVTGKRYAKQSITNYVSARCDALGFKGYSAHGLRHSAGKALAEAGCTPQEIMAILGHVTEKQAMHYCKQARQLKMADNAMAKWESADDPVVGNVMPMATPRKRKYKASKAA